MADHLSRREFVTTAGFLAGGTLLAGSTAAQARADDAPSKSFILGLNTGTIRGYKLSIPETN